MQVNNDQLRELCAKADTSIRNFDTAVFNRCGFTGLSSNLASVQSMFDQINSLAEGDHGIQKLAEWHAEEGRCVTTALKNQCRAICLTDTSTQGDLNGTYDNLAAKGKHEACLPQDMGGLGHGVKLPDGRLARSFASRGIPLAEEPLGQDVDWLAAEFAHFDSDTFSDRATAWIEVGEALTSLSDSLKKLAGEIQETGSKDAYTHEAGNGIRRWASSIHHLGSEAKSISKRLDCFAESYSLARAEVNAVADESDRAKRNATEEHPYNPAVYIEKANAVLRDQ